MTSRSLREGGGRRIVWRHYKDFRSLERYVDIRNDVTHLEDQPATSCQQYLSLSTKYYYNDGTKMLLQSANPKWQSLESSYSILTPKKRIFVGLFVSPNCRVDISQFVSRHGGMQETGRVTPLYSHLNLSCKCQARLPHLFKSSLFITGIGIVQYWHDLVDIAHLKKADRSDKIL